MAFTLSPTALAQGYRLEAYDTIGSTNAVAVERAVAGDAGRLWVVSKRQESGRGRRGRAWATPAGNLAATLLVTGSTELSRVATLGFVAGLALSDALAAIAPGHKLQLGVDGIDGLSDSGGAARVELKWPNDVLAGGAKLAGILLESTLLKDGTYAAAVGIGVNVATHPTDVPYPATSLAVLNTGISPEDLFLALSDAWLDHYHDWNDGLGLAETRLNWLKRAAGLGSEVAVKVDGAVVRGTFETIDEDCRFVIRMRDGQTRCISAGDVHFGGVASARD